MSYKLIITNLGKILMIIGLSMFLPLFWAVYYGHQQDIAAFLISTPITFGVGLLLFKKFQTEETIHYKEGFAIVSFSWLFAAFFGSLPYLISGTFTNFADAFFESMSGFTTTGFTVLRDIQALPPGILFWRSLTNWLGGMGIIVLFVAILSSLGVSGTQMFKAELPGSPVTEKLKPRIRETAKILWYTYLTITVVESILLWFCGMSLFDAICHAFATVATGGVSTKNANIGFYDSPLIYWIITIFMFISGANFSLHYLAFRNKSLKIFWKSEEFKLYFSIIITCALFMTIVLIFTTDLTLGEALTAGTFQTIATITTTAFIINDYEQWPFLLQCLIFALMFIGGCAGSSSGSIKVGRILILLKRAHSEIKRAIHPRMITQLKVRERPVSDDIVINISQFFFLYILIFMFASIILTGLGLDLISALSAAASCLGNVGVGLGLVGPSQDFSFFSEFGKFFLAFLMLLGRLELYTVLVLFSPFFWKR